MLTSKEDLFNFLHIFGNKSCVLILQKKSKQQPDANLEQQFMFTGVTIVFTCKY